MKKPQFITVIVALILVTGIFFGGRTTPRKKSVPVESQQTSSEHSHDNGAVTIDTIMLLAKKQLSPGQLTRINGLENEITGGNQSHSGAAVRERELQIYRQLAGFWVDTARIFEPYAWYLAEAARLENSEKSLTFAARLFLDNLQGDDVVERRKWKALQAKDLFERSLIINPANDSAKVGLGACYLFGGISATPMEGILKIREVAERDSTNLYAQMMLGMASLISGQYDKAITRLQTVHRQQPDNLDAILLLAEVYERTGDKTSAIAWYRKSLPLEKQPEAKKAIQERIEELGK